MASWRISTSSRGSSARFASASTDMARARVCDGSTTPLTRRTKAMLSCRRWSAVVAAGAGDTALAHRNKSAVATIAAGTPPRTRHADTRVTPRDTDSASDENRHCIASCQCDQDSHGTPRGRFGGTCMVCVGWGGAAEPASGREAARSGLVKPINSSQFGKIA